jgi:hypothetical protein
MEYDEFLLDVRHDGEIKATLVTHEGGTDEEEGRLGLSERERGWVHEDVALLHQGKLDERGLRRMGECLYDALFPDKVGGFFEQTVETARGKGRRVRVRISVDPRCEAVAWPLEFLRCTASGGFWLATRKDLVTLSRLGGRKYRKEPYPPPLKVLVVASKPRGLGGVLSAKTLEKIGQWATGELEAPSLPPTPPARLAMARRVSERRPEIDVKLLGVVEEFEQKVPGVQYLDMPATFTNIGQVAEAGEWRPHVLHFIGHGDLKDNQGCLALVKDGEEEAWYNAREFAALFNGWRPRLVVLQACQSALPPTGPGLMTGSGFMSLAAYLMERDIPAVVAMQYEIGNDCATEFAAGFYEALAKGLEIDMAVQEGRWKISWSTELDVRWTKRAFGTPVLFMLSPDGIIHPVAAIGTGPPPVSTVARQVEERQVLTGPPPPPSSLADKFEILLERSKEFARMGEKELARATLKRADEILGGEKGKAFGSASDQVRQQRQDQGLSPSKSAASGD